MTPNAHHEALRRACASEGCTIGAARLGSVHGAPRAIGEVECAHGWSAARLLVRLAAEDAQHKYVRELAAPLAALHPSARAAALHAWVRARVRFAPEQGEVFVSPAALLRAGVGDCDDHARTVIALAIAAGIPARLALLSRDGRTPSHAVAQLHDGAAWRWAETTVAANFGEHPIAAARRLGVASRRADLASRVSTMDPRRLPTRTAPLRSTPDQIESDRRMLVMLGYLPSHVDAAAGLGDEFRAAVAAFQADRRVLPVDGLTGPTTREALRRAVDGAAPGAPAGVTMGAVDVRHTRDLSDGFFAGLHRMGAELGFEPEHMLSVMLSESGIRASAVNRSATAHGLTQIQNLAGVGWKGTPAAFRALSAEAQLPYVRAFFAPWAKYGLGSTGRLYQANFLPATMSWGDDPSLAIACKDGKRYAIEPRAYADNIGFDVERKGCITIADLSRHVERRKVAEAARWNEAAARLRAISPRPDAVATVARLGGATAVLYGAAKLLPLLFV